MLRTIGIKHYAETSAMPVLPARCAKTNPNGTLVGATVGRNEISYEIEAKRLVRLDRYYALWPALCAVCAYRGLQ